MRLHLIHGRHHGIRTPPRQALDLLNVEVRHTDGPHLASFLRCLQSQPRVREERLAGGDVAVGAPWPQDVVGAGPALGAGRRASRRRLGVRNGPMQKQLVDIVQAQLPQDAIHRHRHVLWRKIRHPHLARHPDFLPLDATISGRNRTPDASADLVLIHVYLRSINVPIPGMAYCMKDGILDILGLALPGAKAHHGHRRAVVEPPP
mmetsp:Transcript_86775/g.244622  ORF Transcript_86775/g.244622 Transcript_86775/m.244622 type:complete len:205 (-) Transcript_86775:153-767(-)